MSEFLEIIQAGPGMTLQDRGRPGFGRYGLSAGGAMDQFALDELDTLLAQRSTGMAIEISAAGGSFRLDANPRWCATAGAPMRLLVDGEPVPWRSSVRIEPGATIAISADPSHDTPGNWGYLGLEGGFDIEPEIGAVGTHLRAGVGGLNGRALEAGDQLNLAPAESTLTYPQRLPDPDYLGCTTLRIVWGAQSNRFRDSSRDRLLEETFSLSHRRDRMAMRLEIGSDVEPFEALLGGLSDPIQPGDIQMTGDGVPAILMREHQPTGGYPRIASVISADLDAAAQLPSATPFQFRLATIDEATGELRDRELAIESLTNQRQPVVRAPEQIRNLLAYNLIGGVVFAE